MKTAKKMAAVLISPIVIRQIIIFFKFARMNFIKDMQSSFWPNLKFLPNLPYLVALFELGL